MAEFEKARFWEDATQVTDFNAEWKQRQLRYIGKMLEHEGLSPDSVIVDVGSGRHPVSEFLASDDSHIITVDVVKPDESVSDTHILTDIDKLLREDSFSTRKAEVRAAKALKVDARTTSPEQVDTFIFSDSLNYVDYKQTLQRAYHYLKPGGVFVILNQPGRTFEGTDYVIDAAGLHDNQELSDFLADLEMDEVGKNITRDGYLVGVFKKRPAPQDPEGVNQ